MRFAIAIVSVAWACTAAQARDHGSLPYRALVPMPPKVPAGCTGGSDNEIAIGSALGSDLPVIVLDDDFVGCFNDPPRPRVAIWSDGTIVFARTGVRFGVESEELVQGAISPSEVDKLVADVADAVEHSPRRFDTHDPTGLGGGDTSLVVWSHGHWHAAVVSGELKEDFIGAGTQRVAQPAPPAPPGSDEYGVSLDGSFVRPPLPFARAYKELLDVRPADGAPITRDDLSVTFFPLRVAGSEALARKRAKIAWPATLPQPPADVEPCTDDRECVRDIPSAQREPADELLREIYRASFAVDLTARGQHFLARFDSHYHGERDILRLERCAEHLGAPAP